MLHHWFHVSVIIFVVVAQENEYYAFTEDEETLSMCIENYLKNCNDSYYRDLETVKDIADLAAKRFHGKSRKKQNLYSLSNQFYYYLRDKQSNLFLNHKIYEPLQYEIRYALISCVGNVDILQIPIFKDEPVEVAALLDYILVDWPHSIFEMIFSRPGRKLLRKFVAEALPRLFSALNYVNNTESFRIILRSYWVMRAQYYFNGYDKQVPYLRHRYSIKHPFLHTYDNLTALFARNAYSFQDRDPQISKEYYQRIMKIHVADLPGYGENDVFSLYERNGGMTSAEYYIETHLDQFYRIIFFFAELQVRGISSDEDDNYMAQLPGYVMPFQRMMRKDSAYSTYLLILRQQLKRLTTKNTQLQVYVRQSFSSARVWEEDLITLFSKWIQQNVYDSTVSTPFTTRTLKCNQKRKGSVWVNKNGKSFCKRPEFFSEEPRQPQMDNEIKSLAVNDSVVQQFFPEDESSVFMSNVMNAVIEFLGDFNNDEL